ncbi:hypothetical protein [Armatimonas rosea]|uniref:Uncharacterized protein n=1 Tax=Armatimonas rosea TaxID=685828 RepID=A0A7W9W744_ARMRO|nr:hypothetical protein [Armatimonas rosea]MBB6051273.1 hypothetical protein [Armatimonas rosea]
MTIAVISETPEKDTQRVHVFTKNKEASGETLGAALDALQLTDSLWEGSEEPYLLLRRFQADRFFPTPQRERLRALMAQWREAQESAQPFATELQSELESLIQAEEEATIARSQALLEATRK